MKRDVLRAVFLGAAYVLTSSVLFAVFRSLAAAERGGAGVGGEIMAFVLPAVLYINIYKHTRYSGTVPGRAEMRK